MNNHNDDFASKNNCSLRSTAQRRPRRSVRQSMKRLWKSQRGAALLEYVMLGVLVAVFAFEAVKALGGNVDSAFKNLSGTVGKLAGAGGTGTQTPTQTR